MVKTMPFLQISQLPPLRLHSVNDRILRHRCSSNLCPAAFPATNHYRQRHTSRSASLRPVVEDRLFSPAIFDESKLKVLFLVGGSSNYDASREADELKLQQQKTQAYDEHADEEATLLALRRAHPAQTPRAYTLTHSDLTSTLTLAISHTINIPQIRGWYSRLQRDEVVAEWKKSQGSMSLHVHCHISGGHCLLNLIAQLRFYIFHKELPVVLQAFRHGDEALFRNHPELEESLVWVYFHSNIDKFNIVECWGTLQEAAAQNSKKVCDSIVHQQRHQPPPQSCTHSCNCCFPHWDVIPSSYYHGPSFQDEIYMNGIINIRDAFNIMSNWRVVDKLGDKYFSMK